MSLRFATRFGCQSCKSSENLESIPFDVHEMRTILIDNRDIYALVPKLETYRSEIANQVRRSLEAGAEVDTPYRFISPTLK
jgi:hypothetical protein